MLNNIITIIEEYLLTNPTAKLADIDKHIRTTNGIRHTNVYRISKGTLLLLDIADLDSVVIVSYDNIYKILEVSILEVDFKFKRN